MFCNLKSKSQVIILYDRTLENCKSSINDNRTFIEHLLFTKLYAK